MSDEPTEPTEPTEAVGPPAADHVHTVPRRTAGAVAAGALVLGALFGWLVTKAFDDDEPARPISFQQDGGFPGGGPGGPQGMPGMPGHGFPGGPGHGGPPWMGHDDDGGWDDQYEDRDQGDDQDDDHDDGGDGTTTTNP